jgi:hypothetical protein
MDTKSEKAFCDLRAAGRPGARDCPSHQENLMTRIVLLFIKKKV